MDPLRPDDLPADPPVVSPAPRPAWGSRVTGSPFDRVLRVWRDEYDTLVSWPKGRRHILRRAVAITVVDTLALILAAWLLPAVRIDNLVAAFLATIMAGLLTFLLRPIAFLVLRQSIVVTAVLTVVFMGVTLQ